MQIIYKRYILWALSGLYMLATGGQSYACVITYIACHSKFLNNFCNFESLRAKLPASDA